MKKILSLMAMCALLSACATGAKVGNMAVGVDQSRIVTSDFALKEAVSVGEVKGGKKTNALWMSKISNENFTDALKQSLAGHTILANGAGKYSLSADLVELKQPIFGFNMTVTTTVHYIIKAVDSGSVAFDEIVVTPYTAKVSDAFVGVERLRLANEGSVRENIKKFIELLIAKFPDKPAVAESVSSN